MFALLKATVRQDKPTCNSFTASIDQRPTTNKHCEIICNKISFKALAHYEASFVVVHLRVGFNFRRSFVSHAI